MDSSFFYECVDLQDLVRRYYYSASASIAHLAPADVARELGLAVNALRRAVPAPHSESVFFGSAEHAQSYMQDALLVGVLAYLRAYGPPVSWEAVLASLHFPTTDWNFRSWSVSFHETRHSVQTPVARRDGRSNVVRRSSPRSRSMAELLRGNDAHVELAFSESHTIRKPSKAGRATARVKGGQLSSQSRPEGTCDYGEVQQRCGSLCRRPEARRWQGTPEYPLSGLVLDASQHASPLVMVLRWRLHGYGIHGGDIHQVVAA
jgi:hypothetical protein